MGREGDLDVSFSVWLDQDMGFPKLRPQPDFERGTLGHQPGQEGNSAAGPVDAWDVCPPISRHVPGTAAFARDRSCCCGASAAGL